MTRLQWITILFSAALFVLLYFVLDRRRPGLEQVERSRALEEMIIDPMLLIRESKGLLNPAQRQEIIALEEQVELLAEDSAKLGLWEQLSGKWYEFNQPALAGYYAGEIARVRNTGEAWAITGTTFTLCLRNTKAEKIREYCTQEAVRALENAISLDPEDVANRLNLALVHTENPPATEPMKGVLMLRQLNQEYPGNVPILNNLGRLAIQTGQFEKAIERLQQALEKDPGNRQSICLLEQAYSGAGMTEKAQEYAALCAQRN